MLCPKTPAYEASSLKHRRSGNSGSKFRTMARSLMKSEMLALPFKFVGLRSVCPRFFQLIKQRKTKSRATPVETASTAARRPQLPKTLRVGEHLLEMKVKQITTSPNRRAVPTTKATWFMLVEIATVLVVKAMLTQPILMMQLAKNGDYLEWKRIRRSNEC